MKSKLFIFLLLGLILLSLANATTWTRATEYNEEDIREVTFTNWWGLGGEQGKVILQSHELVKKDTIKTLEVGTGWQVTMFYEFDFYENLSNVLGDVTFIDMKTGKEVYRDWKFVTRGEVIIEREECIEYATAEKGNIYDLKCLKYETTKEIKQDWVDYKTRDIKAEKIIIGLMVYVLPNEHIDGVWKVGSKTLDKHAEWNSSLETSLIYWFNLDETSGVTALNVHNKSMNGTADSLYVFNSSITGILKGGANFNASNRNITYSDALLPVSTQPYSVSYWAYPKSYTSWLAHVSYGSRSTNQMRFLGQASNKFCASQSGGSVCSNATYQLNTWTHVVWVYNSTHWLVYVNGTLSNFGTMTTNTVRGRGNLGSSLAFDYYDGYLDEVGIWNRTLSTAEITLLYNSGTGITYPTLVVPYLNLTINKASPQTYGETINITCLTNSNTTLKGYVNNTEITLNTNILLGAGTWAIKCNTTEDDYWASATNSTNFTINKATPTGTITGTTPIGFGSPANIEGTETNTGDGDVNYTLYRNGTYVSNPDLNTTLPLGTYLYVYNTTGGANYSANSSMSTFLLDVEELPGVTTVLTKPDNALLTKSTEILMYANISAVGGVKLKNYTAYVWDNSNVLVNTQTYDIESSNLFNYNATHTTSTLTSGEYKWNFRTCSNDSSVDCTFGLSNRTFEIDTVLPSILATLNETVLYSEGDAVSLLYSITDDNLASCFYEYNGSNNTITCGEGLTEDITTTLSKLNIKVWANDTAGNYNSYQLNLTVDPNKPTIVINSGNTTENYGYSGINHTINFTVTDSNLEECWMDYVGFFNENDWVVGSSASSNLTKDGYVTANSSANDVAITTYFGGPKSGIWWESNAGTLANWSSVRSDPLCDFSSITTRPEIPLAGNIGKYICVKTLEHGDFIAQINATGTWRYKPINRTVACTSGSPNTVNFEVNNTFYYARINTLDAANNYATRDVEWDYRVFFVNEDYTASTTSGSTNQFTLNLNTDGAQITVARINYNGTFYNGFINSTGDSYTMIRNILAPGVQEETNLTFFWNVTLADGSYFVTDSYNQLITPIILTDVCVGNYTVFNITLNDEVTTNRLNMSAIGMEIKSDMILYTSDRSTQLRQYSFKVTNNDTALICIDSNLSDGQVYSVDLQIQYSADNYSTEFYHIERYLLSSSSLNYNISLYDLEEERTQNFRLIVRDSAYIPIDNALVRIDRKYIDEGIFRSVEIPRTDKRGITSASLELNDVIYSFYVYKEGVLLSSFTNVRAICQTPLISQCEIDFSAVSSEITIPNYEEGDDFNFTLGYNKTSRIINSQFVIPSGEPAFVQLVVTSSDALGTSVCSDSITSASGTLFCNVPNNFGNSTVLVKLYKDSVEQGFGTIKLDQSSRDIFGVILVMISILVMMTLIGIGVSDNPVITAVFLFVGVVLIYSMNFVENTGYFGAGATILFLGIALILVIIKTARRT